MSVHEYIVVGSGATGSMAAQTLVEAGLEVFMLDGGQRDDRYASIIPDKPFIDLRTTDEEQHRYFLGDLFEGVSPDPVGTGAQLTPPRQFINAEVSRFLPLTSDSFFPLESLALGGLASGWGLGCGVFSDAELRKAGLPPAEMKAAYEVVAGRVGISGSEDDARPYTSAHLRGIMPATPLDRAPSTLLGSYSKKRDRLREDGFRLGRPAMALLTQDYDGRKATSMNDMDFYSDAGRSAWRAWIAIDQLRVRANFTYAGNFLVTRFQEEDGVVTVFGIGMKTLQERSYQCRRLVLASGTLGTARIVLRSNAGRDVKIPILSNPYTYVPSIVFASVGQSVPRKKASLCQLVLLHDQDGKHEDVAQAGIYTYHSLLLFRLLKEVPLNHVDARVLMRYLLSGFLIIGIFHPEGHSVDKLLWLEPDARSITGDRLHATYRLTAGETDRIEKREQQYMRAIRTMGAWPIKRIRPGHGAGIHYAGTLPFSEAEHPYGLAPSGRLHGTKAVYVADGSGFRYLPAKGLTLSLMAQAHLVASRLVARS
jgi:choline dehydrogenase-like flavoprotein